jgi:hypothetical protein
LIAECVRVLHSGGWLVLEEIEIGDISSPAWTALYRAVLQAYLPLEKAADSSGLTQGVAARLYPMLIQTQLNGVTYDLHMIDLGFKGGNAAQHLLMEALDQIVLLKPIIIQQGRLCDQSFDQLVMQARRELQAPDLCGWAMSIVAYGCKSVIDE